MKTTFLTGVLSAYMIAMPVCAQDNSAMRAGQQIGRALFGAPPNDDAYYRGMADGALTRQAMEAAARERSEEADAATREALARTWRRAGLSENEAYAVAAAYRYDPAEEAIIERAKREGSALTYTAVANAYKNYNYLLANQLLIGALLAQRAERQAATAQGVTSADQR